MGSYRVYNIDEELMDDMTQSTNLSKNGTLATALFFFYEEKIMKPILKSLEDNGFEITDLQALGSTNYTIKAIDKNKKETVLFERTEKTGLLRIASKEQIDKLLSSDNTPLD